MRKASVMAVVRNKSIVFVGSGPLAYDCLQMLLRKAYNIVYILTHRDQGSESVDALARDRQIAYSYTDLRKNEKLQQQLHGSILISVNYRYILPAFILRQFEYCLNLHGSLLPAYRGRTPHVWAIIHGEKYAGVSCHVMEATVDTGPIYHQIPVEIEAVDTGYSILEKYRQYYPECLERSLRKIDAGCLPEPQKHELATYFGKRVPEMGHLDFNRSAQALIDFIRAQARPYPGAFCFTGKGQKLIVHRAEQCVNVNAIIAGLGVLCFDGEYFYVRVADGFVRFVEFELVN